MTRRPSLSPKERWCLLFLADQGRGTTRSAAEQARDSLVNRERNWSEWANDPFRCLRRKRLIEVTGRRDPVSRRIIHQITEAGRAYAAALMQEAEG